MTAIKALKPIALPPSEPLCEAGDRPMMVWLDVCDLVIDDRYQRPITASGEKLITEIARRFAWSKFSTVIVTPIEGNRYAIIDGQHRATAALSRGFKQVPCYVVKASPDEAARIFASVNGSVAPMTPMAVYKAALAGKVQWAISVKRAAESAGVIPLTAPIPAKSRKTGDTFAVATMRKVVQNNGEAVLALALKCLMASKGAEAPGFISSRLIARLAQVLVSRPGWIQKPAITAEAFAAIDLRLMDVGQFETQLIRQIGDGRSSGDTWPVIVGKVRDLKERKFSSTMIASTLRITYADVEKALREIAA